MYKIRRYGEKYHASKSKQHRMMLWHGTKKVLVPSILQNGFSLPAANTSNRLMYGTGVYFADRASKSAGYCDGTSTGTTALMFLCDVKLGNVYKCKNAHNEYTTPPAKFDTVKANGNFHPDWKENKYYHGSILPVGKTIANTRFTEFAVRYNEYIVYEPSRVVMSFLVEITFA